MAALDGHKFRSGPAAPWRKPQLLEALAGLLLAALLASGCITTAATPSPTAGPISPSAGPPATPTGQPSPPPTETPTPSPPPATPTTAAPTSTPAYDPAGLPVISPENAARLQPLARLEGALTFSPDGATFALVRPDGIALLEAQTLAEIGFLPCQKEAACAFAFSPTGESIAYSPRAGVVQLWDIAGHSLAGELEGASQGCCELLTFSPDGRLLALSDFPTLMVWDLAAGQAALTLPNADRPFFSPDGKTLAFTSAEALQVVLWDLATNQAIGALSGFETAAPIYSAQFSPDWRSLLWLSRASAQLMDVASGRLGPPLTLSAGEFSPDGRLLAGTEQGWGEFPCTRQVCLYEVESSELLASLPHAEIIWHMDFSPAGRLLASADRQGVHLWEVKSGSALASLPLEREEFQGMAFSPDGRLLALIYPGGPTALWGAP